ncbi:radical SAM protein [Thermosipho ferrireducens]|uniref:Radical SAM protein n=1 Tax=Thermosipho ferrireducens TaxID=2571116 RepID=A0ABX7S7R5_9BACT|nr:radical SAM protein [Thermosipho ferrireducens]QTA38629.1 radical SAM protein [Thermosipho ferrireducens]
MSRFKYDFEAVKERVDERIRREVNEKFPGIILIDNVSFCNLRCSMCSHKDMVRKPGFMEWELYKKIIDEIAEERPDARVWITYFGEGLLLKDLDERIKYAKEKGLKDVVLNSNGVLLPLNNWADRLVKAGLDALYVGIDAYYKETYEKLRVGGDFDSVVEGVLLYKKALQRYGRDGQRLFVQFVEMEENSSEVEKFIEFWRGKGVNVKIRPKVSWAGRIEAKNLKEFEKRLPCFWGLNTMNIAHDGSVCLCAIDLDCQTKMGNINEKSLKEVWNTALKDFRKVHLKGMWEILPEMCKKCKDWQSGYAEYIS